MRNRITKKWGQKHNISGVDTWKKNLSRFYIPHLHAATPWGVCVPRVKTFTSLMYGQSYILKYLKKMDAVCGMAWEDSEKREGKDRRKEGRAERIGFHGELALMWRYGCFCFNL